MTSFAAVRSMVDRWLADGQDRCTITTPGAAPIFDPASGYADPAGVTVYSGPCWVRPAGGASVVEAGDAPISLGMYDVWLPVTATGIEKDQLVTIVSADPYFADRTFRVTDVQGGSGAAYRKLLVEDTLTVSFDA